jgi:hypothetical protein
VLLAWGSVPTWHRAGYLWNDGNYAELLRQDVHESQSILDGDETRAAGVKICEGLASFVRVD